MSSTMWIILFGALATYLTRIGGHVVLSRFKRIHPRVQAGLNAVPAAVLTTLVAPATFNAGPAEWMAILASAAVYWMRGLMSGLAAGVIVLVVMRQLLGG